MNRAARVMRVAREAAAAERDAELSVVPRKSGRHTQAPSWDGPARPAEAPTSFGPVVLGGRGAAPASGVYVAPRHGTVVAVTSVGGAEGARGAAAALSCAGSGSRRRRCSSMSAAACRARR